MPLSAVLLLFLLPCCAVVRSAHDGLLLADQHLAWGRSLGLLDVSGGCHDDRALALPLAFRVPCCQVCCKLQILLWCIPAVPSHLLCKAASYGLAAMEGKQVAQHPIAVIQAVDAKMSER